MRVTHASQADWHLQQGSDHTHTTAHNFSLSAAQRSCSLRLFPVTCNGTSYIFKVHYSLHASKTKVPACKLSLMKSQNKATDVLNTNYITQFKSFFKKNCAFALYFLSHYVCRGNAFRGICTLPSRLEDFSSVVPS